MPERRDLERFTYWEGQMLRSRDFRDDAAFEAQRRRSHNRALHAPFGVSYGLRVTAGSAAGAPVFSVQCGLAYDCQGRELILPENRTAPLLPAGPDPQFLIVQYAASGAQLTWQSASAAGIPPGVPLARVTPAPGGATLDETFVIPHARAMARPRLATGDTVRGDTPWEPWIEEITNLDGVPHPETVGVQTHIDTSAAGFTEVPHYFAELQWPNLSDPTAAAFAPAFFPSLAGEESGGFVFRLLMKNIARRRVALRFGVTAVAALPQPSAPLNVQVDDATGFQAEDVVARVRPRAVLAAAVQGAEGKDLTLDSPLDGIADGDTVAVGRGLRTSTVSKAPSKETVTAFQPAAPLATPAQPGDFVVPLSPPGTVPVRVLDLHDDQIILDAILPSLNTGDQVGIARQTDLFPITAVDVDENTGVMTVTVQNGTAFNNGDTIFQLSVDGTPGPSASVSSIAANVLTLAAPITGLSNTDQLGRVNQKVLVGGTVAKPLVLRVTVKNAAVFRAGDVVARADGGAAPAAIIDKVDAKKNILTLSTAIPLDKDNALTAAFPAGSSRILTAPAGAVTVASPSVFQNGDVVMKFGDGQEFETLSIITGIGPNGQLSISPPLAGLQSGDVLAAMRFPHIATINQVIPYSGAITLLLLDAPSTFRNGDLVMRASDAGTTTSLAIVLSTSGLLVLFGAIPNLKAGDQLVPVTFTGVAEVAGQPPDNTHLSLDRNLDIRTGDLIGPLAGYFETSPSATIGKISIGNTADILTLSGAIDGLIPGDIVGPASLTPSQTTVRFDTANDNVSDLHQGDLLMVSGLDPIFLQFVNAKMQIAALDRQTGVAGLTAVEGSGGSFRPETLSIAALFNANFTDAFVAFAQQQDLYVCWLGCQNETQPPAGCPGAASNGSPCPQKGN